MKSKIGNTPKQHEKDNHKNALIFLFTWTILAIALMVVFMIKIEMVYFKCFCGFIAGMLFVCLMILVKYTLHLRKEGTFKNDKNKSRDPKEKC